MWNTLGNTRAELLEILTVVIGGKGLMGSTGSAHQWRLKLV